MGTTVRVLTSDDAPTDVVSVSARRILRTFEREEARFSRFRSDSELSLVNAVAGRPMRVSLLFASVVRSALDAAASTEGLFDPTVLGAMDAIGYDRDFDELLAGARGALHPIHPCGRWRDVTLEDDHLTLPAGVGLDLGGVGQGVDSRSRCGPWRRTGTPVGARQRRRRSADRGRCAPDRHRGRGSR
jgi:FAD:protein FMN transferase